MHLSKSDFKVARTCPTKLYYRKLRYPATTDGDPYLEFLADGGYMVETIAKLMFPEGRETGFGQGEDAVGQTTAALQAENATLFEATVQHGLLLARIDILEKRGNRFRLIEVKAKSFRSDTEGSPFRGARGGIISKWRPYLEDVAFQTMILRKLFPNAEVQPYLCLVDKAETCSISTIFDKFQFTPIAPDGPGPRFRRPKVTFIGDVEALRNESFIKVLSVGDEVEEVLPDVRAAAAEFSALFAGDVPQREAPEVGTKCKACEYRGVDAARNGFIECWGALATPDPHLLDLYRIDLLGSGGTTAARLIAEGRTALLDVSEEDLRGATGRRQKVQLDWTRRGAEYLDPKLTELLAGCKYPLHFIDFEASRIAVPYHAGMRPYEQVAFQWSCHTIMSPGGELRHAEWINIDTAYPNFAFAESLREVLGTGGTVFVWSPYERSTLRDIRQQMVKYQMQDRQLADWLDGIIADGGPLVDLLLLAKDYYFHPRMKGSLSIKKVLPAVWFENAALRQHPWFSDYVKERNGETIDPYETLDALPFMDEGEASELDAVREGTAAIRTYQEMLYGVNRSNQAFRDTYRQLLLNYCKLDTLAMVMIWMHWTRPL